MRLSLAFCSLWLVWITICNAGGSKIFCYYGSWAVYRNGSGKMDISDIDPTLCTHLIFTFVGITEDGNVRIVDPWVALPDGGGKDGFRKFNALRKISPGLKTLVATGGWDEGSATYSKVMANSSQRTTYVRNVVNFVRRYEFDGFDIDWHFPTQRGGSPDDVENYVLFLKELRESFDEHGLTLTAAVAASQMFARSSYDIPQISKHLHFINLLSYDYRGSWSSHTGHSAPLYAAARETSELDRSLNVNSTVHYWLGQGAPAEKLILGTGLYGLTFVLKNPAQHEPGSPATGPGQEGPYTRQKGFLGYNEICDLTSQGSWTTVWDQESHASYAYSGNQWISYESERSIAEKAKYAKEMGLGGVMTWSLETDDHRGLCGERYPLLKALNRVLRSTSDKTGDRMRPSDAGGAFATTPTTDEEARTACARTNFKYIRDSQNCAKFWICLKIRDNDLKAVPFSCGNGLYFDTHKKACRSEDSVRCS